MMDNTNQINKRLGDYAYKHGLDFAQAFDQWLDWIIDWSAPNKAIEFRCDLAAIMDGMKADSPAFHECYSLVIQDTASNIKQKRWHDAFGSLYEEKVKSGYKASSMGQFFTPDGLCDGMARLMLNGEQRAFIYDPACGSGRLPLALCGHLDMGKFHYFVLGDLDPMSCKMSALNMMLHGMFGIVERRNALTMEFFNGYIINEMCYPLPVAMPSIRRADETECRKNVLLARSYAPRRDDGTEMPAVKIEPSAESEPTQENASEPITETTAPRQLSLFNLDEL